MARPVIGLCTALERARWSVWDQDAFLLARSYVDAVQRAGGLAVMLPPDERAEDDPDEVLDLLDGLILAGGADIDPGAYGASAHAETTHTVPDRDTFEIALARRALERDLPLLGHLSRDAADERRARRDAAPAPAREPRPPRAPPPTRDPSTAPTTTSG